MLERSSTGPNDTKLPPHEIPGVGPHLNVVSGEPEEAEGRGLCFPRPACRPAMAQPLFQIRVLQLVSATANILLL